MSGRRRLRLALGLAALAAGLGCPEAPPARPSLLLVTFDTTRRDHTSLADGPRDTTPRLRALADEGARFDLAYAPSATTAPSHATLFTGRYPIGHGVVKNGLPLPEEASTLAEHLAAEGYDTAGFVSSYVLSERFGLGQGFALWDDDFPAQDAVTKRERWEGLDVEGGFDRPDRRSADRAVTWLAARGAQPFFLFVHFYDPHAPHLPAPGGAPWPPDPDADELRRTVDGYDSSIHGTDAQLGRLLDALEAAGRRDDTLVVVTADHGEGLMQHGLMGHGLQIYEEQVRVPLAVRMPGTVAPGLVLEAPVELVDLAPTALELLGAPPLPGAEGGRSLADALRGRADLDAGRPVFLHRRHFAGEQRGEVRAVGEQFGVREGAFKYVEGREEGTYQLFDLAADPGEERNLFAPGHPEVARLAARLARWRETFGRGAGAPAPVDEDVREGLEALGYVE